MASADAPTADDVFALLEHLLHETRIRHDKRARPVTFDLGADGTWRFEPRAAGALFIKAPLAAGAVTLGRREPPDVEDALRVHTTADVLARLVTAPRFVLRDEDEAWFEGDVEDLLPIAAALDEGKSVLGIRSKERP